MAVDTSVRVTQKAGFTDEPTLTENRRARQIKNRMKNRLTKRLNLYIRSISVTKDKTKLKVLQGKADAINYALILLDEV